MGPMLIKPLKIRLINRKVSGKSIWNIILQQNKRNKYLHSLQFCLTQLNSNSGGHCGACYPAMAVHVISQQRGMLSCTALPFA